MTTTIFTQEGDAEQFHVGDKTFRGVRVTQGVMAGNAQRVSASGDTTLYSPASGNRLRLHWICLTTPASNSASVVASVKLGSQTPYSLEMPAPFAFSHRTRREGQANDALSLNLSGAQPVDVNFDVEEFGP